MLALTEFFSDKIFEKAKCNRLKTIILKSITKDIEVLIRNELLTNKYILSDKSSSERYGNKVNMLREELKSKDFIIKDLLQIYKRNKNKGCLSSIQYIMHV